MTRQRADTLLVDRRFFASRAQARAAIEAGLVRAAGRTVRKPAEPIDADCAIEAAAPHPWVSRGGVKLAAALDAFAIDPAARPCLDIGASTGGFTHVLVSRGAACVTAVDVGHGQLHASLRSHPAVVSLEGLDARALTPAMLPLPPAIITCDASFISAKLILPHVLALAAPQATLVLLIKPQFEAGRARVAKGVVRDAAVHDDVCAEIAALVEALGWVVIGLMPSPIEGGDGNHEFLLGARR